MISNFKGKKLPLSKKDRRALYLKIAKMNEEGIIPKTYYRQSPHYFGFCIAASEEIVGSPWDWCKMSAELFPEYYMMEPEELTADKGWFGINQEERDARATALCLAAELCS